MEKAMGKKFYVDKGNDPTKFYTLGEEVFNAVTHGVGSVLAIIGTTVLVTLCAVHGTAYGVGISLIYGASLIILYTMSTLYHAFTGSHIKRVFRIFDHSTIYLLIAGTYTPLTLGLMRGSARASVICAVVWILAILGIILNCISITKFEKISMLLYVGMGWAVVFMIKDIVAALSPTGFILLLAGGICYTGGIIFYKWNAVRYMHGVWHLFVLAGSVLHYLCVILYAMPVVLA